MKVAAGVAVLVVGGTAAAAETGNLPAAAQKQAHGWFSVLGVPPPSSSRPGPSDAERTVSAVPTHAQPAPTVAPGATTPSAGPGSPGPDASAARGLCRAWQAAGSKPRGKSMAAASRRALADLAGGENAIAGFCARQLADLGSPVTPTPSASATTSHPGNGNGNGSGNGNGNGNADPKGKAKSSQIPGPHQ